QRHVVTVGGASQKALGQAGPVAGQFGRGTEHGQLTRITAAAQHFGTGKAGAAAADDDDFLRLICGLGRDGSRLGGSPAAYKYALAFALDFPAGDGIEGRRADCLAAAQAETGMMPGAAHYLAVDQARI